MARDERTKADYQPWNHEHFMADRYVRRMCSSARKTYVMLLHEAFFCSTRPYLPDDDTELWTLADCDSPAEWEEVKDEVREMFEPIEIDGQKLLTQRRVEEDWERILGKRGVISNARSLAAKRMWAKRKQTDANECKSIQADANVEICMQTDTVVQACMQTDANDAKRSKEKLSKAELSEVKEDHDFPENGQGEEMKAEKTIPVSCQQILGVRAETYPDVINQIKALAIRTSNGQVLREFEEWALDNIGDDFHGKPLTAWLRSLDNPYKSEQKKAAADPEVTHLVRELVYRSDSTVSFDNKQKLELRRVLDEGFTVEEIVGVFKSFFQNLDISRPDEIRFAAKNFVEKAADLADVARRKAQEKAQEAAAVAETSRRLQEQAEEARRAREAQKLAEQELVEETLGD